MDLYCMDLSGFQISIPDNLFIYTNFERKQLLMLRSLRSMKSSKKLILFDSMHTQCVIQI